MDGRPETAYDRNLHSHHRRVHGVAALHEATKLEIEIAKAVLTIWEESPRTQEY